MNKPALVFILGLGHSGTTILDLALGAHPNIVGVGEGANVLKKPVDKKKNNPPVRLRTSERIEHPCTCGETAANCSVWGPTLDWLIENDNELLENKYKYLIKQVKKEYSNAYFIVDSSMGALQSAKSLHKEFNIYILFLVRDIRSWVHSMVTKKNEAVFRILWRWYSKNKKIEAKIINSGITFFTLGYEELALAPENILQSICQWLGLEFHDEMLLPMKNTKSHIVEGNRIRKNLKHAAQITYDGSWLANPNMSKLILLTLPFLKLNQRLVYSNNVLTRR